MQLLCKGTAWQWTEKEQSVFDLLKTVFMTTLILCHFDPDDTIILKCDASDYAITAIILQVDPASQEVQPVTFHT